MVRLLPLRTAAALVFNEVFFASFDPLAGTLLAFATFAVGFVARPVGGVVFGHYGDRVGRRKILVITLLIMGGAPFSIGCLDGGCADGEGDQVLPAAARDAVCARLGVDVAFYTFALFVLTYVTTELGMAKSTALAGVLVGSALQVVLIPYFGHLSDKRGRRPVYLGGAVGAAIWAFVFFPLLDTKEPLLVVLAAVVGLAFHAAMYGPQAAFITELFGTEVRYSGASLGYQLAGIFGGALAPIIAITLLDRFDSRRSPSRSTCW